MRNSDLKRQDLARSVRTMPLPELLQGFRDEGVERAFIVFENGQLTLSHPKLLAPLKAFMELSVDFARHEAVFIGTEPDVPTLFFAFVHDTRRGLSQGGLRYRAYGTVGQILEDGLRLSQGMTRKNALAGLWWGGGKGILPVTPAMETPAYRTENTPERHHVFRAYARFVASLGGVYYTAEDVGTKTSDMDAMLAQNRFQTCISDRFGGSGNPSSATAKGVFWSMQAAWRFLTGSESLRGVKVAVQGAGNVGGVLIRLLDDAGAEVWTCDLHQPTLDQLRRERPRVHVVPPDGILSLPVDVLAPCAIGDQINVTTIPTLKAKLICGAANNILGEPADAERLRERDILFVPDYVCNRMGITNCADEWQGYLADDVQVAAQRLYPDTLRILKHARNLVITTTEAADELADLAASELHPQLGHRGRRIIDHLMASGWHRGGRGAGEQRGERQGEHRGEHQGDPIFEPALHEPEIRLRWNRPGHFHQATTAVAAAPVSTASRPSLDGVLSAVLMDVRARALEAETGSPCRRVVGADHGGLNLQLAVERSLPYPREEVGREEVFEACEDQHNRNDAAVREQLKQLGVDFDPKAWTDPMDPTGSAVVRRLYHALDDAGLISREQRLGRHCPRCQTVLVSSDLKPVHLRVSRRFTVRFSFADGPSEPLEVATFFPELLVGAVAVAVGAKGPFAGAVGKTVKHPLEDRTLPVIAAGSPAQEADLLVPAASDADALRAREANLGEGPPVFDGAGQVYLPGGEVLPRQEARRRVLELLGGRVSSESGTWRLDAQRCRRCETLVVPSRSEQLLLHLERGTDALRQAIHSGAVSFGGGPWKERVLKHLENLEPFCISRQQWWGNPLPGRPGEVLSTWFSLFASALEGAGWPDRAMLEPVSEVYVTPELLGRWVVPSQLVALALTGRPVFRRIVVHGSVHIVDRDLVPIEGVPPDAADEERFTVHSRLLPMRKQLGNVVEPESLVRRFGADALRLGYLLCLGQGAPNVLTLSESALRRARRTLHRLVAQAGGLHRSLGEAEGREPDLLERWLVARAADAARRAREALGSADLGRAAHGMVEAVEDLRRFGRARSLGRKNGRDAQDEAGAGTSPETLGTALALLGQAYHPLCPFTFTKLGSWARENGLPTEARGGTEDAWLVAVVRALDDAGKGRPAVLVAADEETRRFLAAGRRQLEHLTGATLAEAVELDAGGSTQVRIPGSSGDSEVA